MSNAQHYVHNLIILDESGSMQSIKRKTIEGFNEIVQTIKGIEKQFPDQRHFISFVSFNGLGNKLHHIADPVSKLGKLNDKNYNPDASTPLLDAIGFAVNKLKLIVAGQEKYNVLVTIFTDGEENASKEYTGSAIKALIDELQAQNWTFTYIGTDHDVTKMAESLSIHNSVSFDKTDEGLHDYFRQEKNARILYSKRIENNEDTTKNFYQDDEEDMPF